MVENAEKLRRITQKISELTEKKKAIETAYAEDLAKKITKLLLKKRPLRFDTSRLLNAVEKALEALEKEKT